MKTRKLGATGVDISVIGLGTLGMGGGPWHYTWGPQSDKDSRDTIIRALDAGINWVDTAPVYGFGHAEELIGDVIAALPHKPLLSTKCGLVWDDMKKIQASLTPDSMRQELEASLKRLKVETIDFYQVQIPAPSREVEDAWHAMRRFIDEGKIRFAGIGNVAMNQIEKLNRICPVSFVQAPYNMLDKELEFSILDYCYTHGIGVMVYDALKNGYLSGSRPPQQSNLIRHETLKKIAQVARRMGKTPSQLAVAWCLRKPEITSVIVGSRYSAHIDEIARAADFELSFILRTNIFEITKGPRENRFRKFMRLVWGRR
ncbi:MAG: aldo/keto reductase [Candidatus Omnitrophica bacterium]|nr:aldo/keto reductase [Candidatus Omnitrophota bacterium]